MIVAQSSVQFSGAGQGSGRVRPDRYVTQVPVEGDRPYGSTMCRR